MNHMIVTTFDRVPEAPGGCVRDVRVCQALVDRLHGANHPACRGHGAKGASRPAFARPWADGIAPFATAGDANP